MLAALRRLKRMKILCRYDENCNLKKNDLGNEHTIAEQKLQKPQISVNRRPTKAITTMPDQTSVHWDNTI